MADHHGLGPPPDRGARASSRSAISMSSARNSYEMGESSAAGSSRNDRYEHSDDPFLSPRDSHQDAQQSRRPLARTRRRQRQKSSGGFLLHDRATTEPHTDHRRRTDNASHHTRAKAPPRTPELSYTSPPRNDGSAGTSRRLWKQSSVSPRTSASHGASAGSVASDDGPAAPGSSPFSQSPDAPDIDSTEIVSMALNLSESRRIASRRNVSQPNPPRLVPLPESSSGGALKQHLQQQRRTSRNLSPQPGLGASPRVGSGAWGNSPLTSTFGAGDDASFQYHFSASTLSRARKAREHLELMSQYRQLLEVLPPLKPGHDRQPMFSPPTSPSAQTRPTNFPSSAGLANGHRRYNPLQYIRNRKVRARERKVIDGERQGFGDVENVSAWVEHASNRAASHSSLSASSDSVLPPFPPAEDTDRQEPADAASRSAHRTRRPRVDWFFEPCDMIADAYWLEQERHKHLIEDRQWRKIFPLPLDGPRPFSRPTEEPLAGLSRPPTRNYEDAEPAFDAADHKLVKTDTDLSQISTKERAKQKLHDFKGFHHKHNSSGHAHHDILRMRKDSDTDLSDSENDASAELKRRTRRGRSGTITSDANDLLQKQMLEMISKEEQDKVLEDVPETDAEHYRPNSLVTPERNHDTTSPDRFSHSRKESTGDAVASDSKRPSNDFHRRSSLSHQYAAGHSASRPEHERKRSADQDLSFPNTPEPRLSRNQETGGSAELDSSPWSRPTSPTRKQPLARMKRLLRDKDREPANKDADSDTEDEASKLPNSHMGTHKTEHPASPDRGNIASVTTTAKRPGFQHHKSRRSTNSVSVREDQSSGLRSVFKTPRIDTVLRGGVSKLGGILWKKDESNDPATKEEWSDDSSSVEDRDPRRPSAVSADSKTADEEDEVPGSKHFLNTMPRFQHMEDSGKLSLATTRTDDSLRRPSSRFDLLKPPPLDIRSASPSASPSSTRRIRMGDSDVSDSNSSRSNVPDAVRHADKRLNHVLSSQGADGDGRKVSRQWSIADQTRPQSRAQLSKREVARMRALILSSGIKAMEINRRANGRLKPFRDGELYTNGEVPRCNATNIPWADIANLLPDQPEWREEEVAHCELYPLAARGLAMAVQTSCQRWQVSADRFTTQTSQDLHKRIGTLRTRLEDDLSTATRKAVTDADETSHGLALDQPLKVKHVIDIIEKMLRHRRRRFRWVRRAMWLTVEWLVVGFMWYVWFVVMILRVFMGVGKGLWTGVRWLLWL